MNDKKLRFYISLGMNIVVKHSICTITYSICSKLRIAFLSDAIILYGNQILPLSIILNSYLFLISLAVHGDTSCSRSLEMSKVRGVYLYISYVYDNPLAPIVSLRLLSPHCNCNLVVYIVTPF